MQITRETLRQSWKSWLSNEIVPIGPWWLAWVWTLLFAMVIAFGFTLLNFVANVRGTSWFDLRNWLHWYRVNLTVSLCIAVLIQLLFTVLLPLVGRARITRFTPLQRALFFIGVPLVGLAIGWPLGLWIVSDDIAGWIRLENRSSIIASALIALVISLAVFFYFNAKANQMIAEKRSTEAQLRLLQGQIEPHFLFNTLANVLSLIDHDTPKAKQMLEAFTEYLRSSLGTLRHDTSPLGHELDLAEHYLRLLGTRMEERLRYRITADEAVRGHPLPPLLLQPLVENAVHHGLEPSIDGGTVRISATLLHDRLVIEVEDDGLGLDAPTRRPAREGAGMALTNIRQRLRVHYGDAAALEVRAARPDATPPGTLARLTLPLTTSLT